MLSRQFYRALHNSASFGTLFVRCAPSIVHQHRVKCANVASIISPKILLPFEWTENVGIRSCVYGFHTSVPYTQISTQNSKSGFTSDQERLITQMNMRMVNENSFLSWCRNAYLSTVVGVAMITGSSMALAQGAGAGAFLVGGMNLLWGTGCHVTNLIRLRHVTGMSRITLILNLLGSTLHCCLWCFVLICYIGFLDESSSFDQISSKANEEN